MQHQKQKESLTIQLFIHLKQYTMQQQDQNMKRLHEVVVMQFIKFHIL